MKKYFLGLIAIAAAVTFSAFSSPKVSPQTLKLSNDPTSAGIVQDETKWSDGGFVFGACTATPEDLACTITLETTTMSLYTHTNGSGDVVLNDETYARANFNFSNQAGSPRFLTVTESFVNPRYIISAITASKLQQTTINDPVVAVSDSKNIQKQQSLSAGVDVAYFNAKKI